MKKKGSSWMIWLQITITVCVALVIYNKVDWGSVWISWRRIDLVWGAASVFLVMVTLGVTTLRWGFIARGLGSPLKNSTAFRFIWLGMFLNQAMPSTIGSDAARVWLLTREGDQAGRALNGVLLDRVLSLLGILLLISISQPWLLELTGGVAIGYMLLGWVGAMLLGLVGLVVVGGLDLPESRYRIVRGALNLIKDIRIYLLSPRLSLWPVVLTMFNFVVLSAVVYALAKGFGFSLAFEHSLILVPAVFLVSMLPISFAGWGVREGAMIVALGLVGISETDATALSIALGLLLLLIALPGGLFLVTLGGLNKWRRQVEQSEVGQEVDASASDAKSS
ncbi:MAG: flippase-like domain-containing protein [Magnetococcales bacterium]|nr:flippase-like domain-containing protein [Magnetococcales bacterium]